LGPLLPRQKKKNIPEVPKEAKKGLKFTFIKNTTKALKSVLDTD